MTVFVLYIFYSGYKKNQFPFKLTYFALSYEILFNISYMIYRAITHEVNYVSHMSPPFYTFLAIFHGTFSLLMFLALLAFLFTAIKKYKKEENYFYNHKVLTFTFLFFWMIAILSGFIFYYVSYFTLL